MREYRFADARFRGTVKMTAYENEIGMAVHSVNPLAVVTVTDLGFSVEPELTKREIIAVSTILRGASMKNYTMYRPCLFNGYRIEEETEEENIDGNKE